MTSLGAEARQQPQAACSSRSPIARNEPVRFEETKISGNILKSVRSFCSPPSGS